MYSSGFSFSTRKSSFSPNVKEYDDTGLLLGLFSFSIVISMQYENTRYRYLKVHPSSFLRHKGDGCGVNFLEQLPF
jgi:hypothetical protein